MVRVCSPSHLESVRGQRGHLVAPVRNQMKTGPSLLSPFLFSLEPQLMGWSHPLLGWSPNLK